MTINTVKDQTAPEPHAAAHRSTGQDPLIGDTVWPVGSVYISILATNPATLLGFGTWAAIAAGKMLIGLDSGDATMDTPEEIGGAKTHAISVAELPAHNHEENAPSSASGGALRLAIDTNASGTQAVGLNTANTGSGTAMSLMNPFFVVYMWKRTA